MKRAAAATVLFAALLPLAALADAPTPGGYEAPGNQLSPLLDQALFEQLDANKDGFIDGLEAQKSATVKALFVTLDLNRDGRVSAEEWAVGNTVAPPSRSYGGADKLV